MKKKTTKRITIKDIAHQAKVSVATVSMALSADKASNISKETRERVLATAKQLHYRPNFIARSLVTKRTNTIGLVITTLHNPFYSELCQDIIDCSKENSYQVMICSVDGADQEPQINNLINLGIDGLIICSVTRHDPVIADLKRKDVPFVLVMRNVDQEPGNPPVDCVVMDNQHGGFLATEHLIKLDHTRIGLITGPEDVSTAHDRKLGFLAAMAKYGVKAYPDLIVTGDFLRSSGAACTRDLLKHRHRPTAIFVVNDFMAVGVLDALREAGLQAPGDIAIVGFDDIELASFPGMDLTTVSQKKATMGRLAVECLLEKMKGEGDRLVKRIMLDPILIVRQTCGFHIRGYNAEFSPFKTHAKDSPPKARS